MVSALVVNTLRGMGLDVNRPGPVDYPYRGTGGNRGKGGGGIILTASHIRRSGMR